MTFTTLETYLMNKLAVTYDYPFDEEVRVYRVGEKIFALTTDREPLSVNLKCDPVYALELRSLYEAIKPGYHMNKKHWNTVTMGLDVDEALLKDLCDHSYDLIVASLPKKKRELLGF